MLGRTGAAAVRSFMQRQMHGLMIASQEDGISGIRLGKLVITDAHDAHARGQG